MKIVVISDSHGNSIGIDKIFQNIKFDYLFYLGDGLNDLGNYIFLDNVFAVSGNCDFFSDYPNEREFNLNNIKFLITHGNRYFVKKSLSYLQEKAILENIDFVFYGHTHNKMVDSCNGSYLINPGSFHKDSFGKSKGLILDIKSKTDFKIDDLIID